EGWGLAVSEAGQHAVPTVGYHHAAGLRDSIDDGETGLLVDGVDAMADATRGLLAAEAARARLGGAARREAARLSWPATAAAVGEVVRAAGQGRRLGCVVRGPGHGPSAA